MRTCTYEGFVYWAGAQTNCANGARWIYDSTSIICYNFCTALEKMLLMKILFFRWYKISPEGYRQVFTKIDKHHLCQLNNDILQNLSGLDLVRRSQSNVKGHRRGGVCVLRMLLVFGFFIFFFFYMMDSWVWMYQNLRSLNAAFMH